MHNALFLDLFGVMMMWCVFGAIALAIAAQRDKSRKHK